MLAESHLFREIHEQPQVLTRLLDAQKETIRQLSVAIQKRQISHIVIAARGTSDNAARYAKYLLGAVNNLSVGLAAPSLFTIYQQPPRLKDALVLGISQSGTSPDIVAVLAQARRQKALTAVITNRVDSDLGQQADFVIDLHAGVERSVAATKTYTSELAAVALLSASLAQNQQMLAALHQAPQAVANTLAQESEIASMAQRYRYMRHCAVIGRGYNYATAFELALKLKELTYTIAEPYSSADFLHGPVALIEHGFPVIVIAPSGKMLPELQEFVRTLRQRKAEVIVVSDSSAMLALARTPFKLPVSLPEWLSPITAIIPGQILAMHLAHTRDYDPDRPRGLRKVTETR